jgi:hypothetical protein
MTILVNSLSQGKSQGIWKKVWDADVVSCRRALNQVGGCGRGNPESEIQTVFPGAGKKAGNAKKFTALQWRPARATQPRAVRLAFGKARDHIGGAWRSR